MPFDRFRNFLFGKPLETFRISHEKLPKWKALAVFSSDAMSSVAYATQEIMIPLAAVSTISMYSANWSLPIGLLIVIVLVLVATSYYQTIRSYPNGGGAYIVVKENLGMWPGLVTAASLLIDYILTVSVSIAAGVDAIASAFPFVFEHKVFVGIVAIGFITIVNLRGLKESSNAFAIPTYVFIFGLFSLIGAGFFRLLTGSLSVHAGILHEAYPALPGIVLLKAFASGCTALTGIEAISNGVPAFKKPEARNAQLTLLTMAIILGVSFLGVTALTHILGIPFSEHDTETLLSKIGKEVFGGGTPFYYLVQFSTALILFLAANTSYADFPRVCSLLAQDRFLPRQLASLGDRLVFSNGIYVLGLVSSLLLAFYGGKTHSLIPLYAIGVFLSFTLSQFGMVIHHWKDREPMWKASSVLNGFGAVVTLVVLSVITYSKFKDGAWMVILLLPILTLWFRGTRDHYRKVAAQLVLNEDVDFKRPIKHVVVIPISGVHKGVIDAIKYSKSISGDVRAISVDIDDESTERLRTAWKKLDCGIDLIVLESPFRSILTPLIDYIKAVDNEEHDDMVTVVIPEFVTARWWHSMYHNQTAFLIRTALLFEKGKIVTSVRYHLSR